MKMMGLKVRNVDDGAGGEGRKMVRLKLRE